MKLKPLKMATKFNLFRHPHLHFFTSSSPPRAAAKSVFIPFICSSSSITANLSLSTLPYGPSLHKGHCPFLPELRKCPSDDDNSCASFEESFFVRVFEISALRVPSDLCSAFESRLRGHLLNWPRIKNIARVPGDEMEDDFKSMLTSSIDGAEETLAKLNRRVYGKAEGDGEPLTSVLYRDKLARTFNSRGYVNFRNLAKISRPKKRKKRDDGEKRVMRGIGRNELALVEVIEEEDEIGDGDLSRLLGDNIKRTKWKGSTRLLLLDEFLADRGIEELPEAIKAHVFSFQAFCVTLHCQLTICVWESNVLSRSTTDMFLIDCCCL